MDIDPIAYISAGGAISLITAVVTNYLTTTANRESEERQAKRRVEEEQRQAIRQIRRERIQPVVDFLEAAKRKFASQTVGDAFRGLVDDLPQELRSKKSSELAEVTRSAPSTPELTRLFVVALTSSMSIPGLQAKLPILQAGLGPDPKIARKWGPAIESAEELIERYIVSANPNPVRPTGIASQEEVSGPTVGGT